MIHLAPAPIVAARRTSCGECSCPVVFEDACASCPKKLWGPELCPPSPDEMEEERAIQQEHDLPFPAARTLASNLLSAVGSEIKARVSGANELDLEEIKRRYAICEGCEFFHAPSKRCKKCGCYLKWKTAWRSQSCPVGKW
jgi:hypothetical protein